MLPWLCRYGPFWICSTLIFVTASLGNFAAYLSYKSKTTGHWHYDINLMSRAALLFYGYVGLVPLGLYFLLRYLGVVSGLIQLWCLYGYSLFVFIPASVSQLPHPHASLRICEPVLWQFRRLNPSYWFRQRLRLIPLISLVRIVTTRNPLSQLFRKLCHVKLCQL